MPRLLTLLALSVLSLFATGPAAAEGAYPSRAIHLIVPFVPGGTSDILARILGKALADELGQPVIVENKPGAGGNIGSDFIAKSPPDGYNLILTNVGTHAINPSLYRELPYDPVKDFTPVGLIGTVPTVLVVNPSVKANNVRELIALAKAHPGALNYASAGIGTTQQLAGEMFKEQAGIDVVHVPYKGGAQAITDLLGGQVTFMFPNIPVAYPLIKAGKLRALAIASSKRSPTLPDVPTMNEAGGFKGFEVSTWFGILGPAHMPNSLTRRLNSAINKVMLAKDMQEKFAAQGVEVLTDTPAQFDAYIRAEIEKWERIVKAAGIKAQ